GGDLMDLAHDAVEPEPEPQRRRLGWTADNALVRAVGRIRLPLGAKLLIGFAVVGALLAIGYVLGVVALGQSNSRGEQLLRLQRRAVNLQIVLTDAAQLQKMIEFRIVTPGLDPEGLDTGVDQAIANDMAQLCHDSGLSCLRAQPAAHFQLSNVDLKTF